MRTFLAADETIMRLPQRVWVTDTLLPKLAAENPEIVVFAGPASYTHVYEQAFGKNTDYITIDPTQEARAWGSRHHIVDTVENLPRHLPEHSVDVIIFIGIYGKWMEVAALPEFLVMCHRMLKPHGTLVFGWLNVLTEDPAPLFAGSFRHDGTFGLPARKTFPAPTSTVIDVFTAA